MPKPTTRVVSANLEAALSRVVASIARQENAIADALCSEAAKLRSVLSWSGGASDETILATNSSIHSMLRTLDCMEGVLLSKLDVSVEHLGGACPPPQSAAQNIPGISIQVRTSDYRTNERWLVAHIHGTPGPDDRVYLRRLVRYTRRSGIKYELPSKRMAHPQDPELPPHLDNPAYFHGTQFWGGTENPIRSEWEIQKPEEVIYLFALSELDKFTISHTVHRLDFLVARPDPTKKFVTYGPATRSLFIYPQWPILDGNQAPAPGNLAKATPVRWLVKFN
ncbi:hypothetical protein AGMMS49992_14980 [Clostridia bacterium]|nr:hypothetical protein AGMMS49992_14980 [Clostridia bacterium]